MKTKNGIKYRGVYYVNGKKKYTHKPYPTSKREARRQARVLQTAAERRASVDEGLLPPSIKWGDWATDVWWPVRTTGTDEREPIEEQTHNRELDLCNRYLMPQWSETPINTITRKKVQAWVNSLKIGRPGMSPKYGHRIYSLFRTSMISAVTAEVLDANPCVKISIPGSKNLTRPKNTIREGTFQTLWNHLHPHYQFALWLSLQLGVRPGELGGLHWSRVGLESGEVEIREVLVYLRPVKGHSVTPERIIKPYPKNGKARTLPLGEQAVEILRRWQKRYPPMAKCGLVHRPYGVCESDLVFRTPRTRAPLTNQAFSNQIRRARLAAGLPRLSPYSARRGYRELLAECGVDPMAITLLMGHASTEETLGYTEVSPRAMRQCRAALNGPGARNLELVHSGQTTEDSGMSSGTNEGSDLLTSAHIQLRRSLG
ncbi:tyrosine-type recombinase/integrase [Crossiella sp. CA198]|uniref:tyrosine-type recombinase/integrase n=1 Tax=Crossiella sp. CA198 TaxID=3455607 RepID=UPI003F8CF955